MLLATGPRGAVRSRVPAGMVVCSAAQSLWAETFWEALRFVLRLVRQPFSRVEVCYNTLIEIEEVESRWYWW